MVVGLYIFVDDDFSDPIYGEPESDELDEALWEAVCEAANDALEGDVAAEGVRRHGDLRVAWKHLPRFGLTFAVVAEGVQASDLTRYLQAVARRYQEEVENLRHPERAGVADVVVDVIPEWDDEDDQ